MKKVYVVGSGASSEVGLPTGHTLKDNIAKVLGFKFNGAELVQGDLQIIKVLKSMVSRQSGGSGSIQRFVNDAHHIVDALPLAISIDNFLDAQKDTEYAGLLGKLAIVQTILMAERNSKLYVKFSDPNAKLNLKKLESTWYAPFFQLLTENCGPSELEERFGQVALIIFNYDRCIEHFLAHALKRYYRISMAEAAELVSKIEIYHPYGVTGNLALNQGDDGIPFGGNPDSNQLATLAGGIRTFTQGTDPRSSEIIAIRKLIQSASTLNFLGFAFHQTNMELLSPEDLHPKTGSFRCFASTLNISNTDTDAIREQINGLFSNEVEIHFAAVECNRFFTEFWRSLAFKKF